MCLKKKEIRNTVRELYTTEMTQTPKTLRLACYVARCNDIEGVQKRLYQK
jgi:hypothetical protein